MFNFQIENSYKQKAITASIVFCSLVASAVLLPLTGNSQGRVNTGETAAMLSSPTPAQIKSGEKLIRIPEKIKVPPEWIPLLNPAFEEFWREGNHRPDAGLILFARDRTVQAAKLWLIRMETKAKLLENMFSLVRTAQAELIREGVMPDRFEMVDKAKAGTLPALDKKSLGNGLRSLNFFFLFSPECPHCRRLAHVLKSFPNVIPLQATGGQLKHWEGLPPSDRATKETIKEYVGTGGVPVLVVFDPKSSRLLKLRGNQAKEKILIAASTVLNHSQKKVSK